jgi:hypothetical protein
VAGFAGAGGDWLVVFCGGVGAVQEESGLLNFHL